MEENQIAVIHLLTSWSTYRFLATFLLLSIDREFVYLPIAGPHSTTVRMDLEGVPASISY